jgi:hypothetical protein
MISRLDFLHLIGLSSAVPFPRSFDVGPRPDRLTCLWTRPVAGFQFHQGLSVAADLQPGQLLLTHEPDNACDDCAIAVYSASTKLGFVPRSDNAVLAVMLDNGDYQLLGKVEEADPTHRNPWQRLWFSIYHVR